MVIWDKEKMQLAGGKDFSDEKGSVNNKEYSYLESYHPGTEKLKNENFCEIGRTFVMPDLK